MATNTAWVGVNRSHDMDRHARQLAAQEKHQREKVLRAMPWGASQLARKKWAADNAEHGFTVATRNLYALSGYVGTTGLLKKKAPLFAEARIRLRDELHEYSGDSQVKAWARKRAAEAQVFISMVPGVSAQYIACGSFCSQWGVEPVQLSESKQLDPAYLKPAVARMTCQLWWRRRARRALGLMIESDAIAAGKVRRGKAHYISDANMRRGEESARASRQMLLDLVAVNELGECFTVADLADKGVSNPHIRQAELMVRLKGCERLADRLGWHGYFVTWTLPSRFHYWSTEHAGQNPKWDGSTPREGQDYLRTLWARCRASLAKRGTRFFGIRVAEPHADATPHWHMLIFGQGHLHAEILLDTLRRYALRESPEEKGAQEHRFKVEEIDKAKGGATAYVAKYVSKMTTGAGLSETTERGPDGERREIGKPWESAQRAKRWASVHSIRQFQFIGLPPIGVWRELRRMDETPDTLHGKPLTMRQRGILHGARVAADESDYCAHVTALGGAAVPRAEHRLALFKETATMPNKYGDPLGDCKRTTGVCFQLTELPKRDPRVTELMKVSESLTRLHTWTIQTKPRTEGAFDVAFAVPRTRVNNCNQPSDRVMTLDALPRPFHYKFAAIPAADQSPPMSQAAPMAHSETRNED